MKTKGNRKAQNERRKKRLKTRPKRQNHEFELIDGNYSFYPVAFCEYRGAYFTQGLRDTHRCKEKGCGRYKEVDQN